MSICLFDGHCDTAYELWLRGEALPHNTCHIDLGKAEAFRAYAQVFAFCSAAGTAVEEKYGAQALLEKPLAYLRREVERNSERISFARNRAEVEKLWNAGKRAALLSIEGAEVINCDPERLYSLRKQGFRMATLTWNADNALAGWHQSDRGLTDQGREFVKVAQKLDILIDVSHLGEKAFWDLMKITEKPLVASHSNCRGLWEHSRNLTDSQLRAIGETGGTVGLNLYVPFLGKTADMETLLYHLDHMVSLCGENHVALGGDLDGCDKLPAGFSNVADYTKLHDLLLRRGFGKNLTDKIFYENLLRQF